MDGGDLLLLQQLQQNLYPMAYLEQQDFKII